MCGIVGTLSFTNSSFTVTEEYIVRMRETMEHRGPDSEGVWISKDGRIGLGHRRLSIIDLSESAAQPMCNEDSIIWITYNGEIYNHREIRAELSKNGRHIWKTDHSDTEVILHAFEEWGIECLDKLRGMFAFALWDGRRRELWLVRDRIGIKPLYYSIHHGRIVFASEIKALLEDPDQKKAVHEEAFYHYLSFLTTPAPQTLFEGVKKLPGGTWIKISEKGDIREERYWDVLDYTEPMLNASEEEIAQLLLDELRSSVSFRKVSDVPVGVFLSGGIDSSANTALFSEGEGESVKTFCIGYDRDYGTYKNETGYARMMAGQVGAEYHERLLTVDDLIDFLPSMIRLQDEPIADPVCVPVYYVSKLARDNGVIVCQVGEGSDELFCGYPIWGRILRLSTLLNLPIPRIIKKMGLLGFQLIKKRNHIYPELLRRSCDNLPIFWGGTWAFTETAKFDLLSETMKKKFKGRTSWESIKKFYTRFIAISKNKSFLNWMTYLDLNFRLPELLLMRVDKMSMGVSLECRVPFLDHKFVELSMSIPPELKIKDRILKYILKKSVRGMIPDEIIDRKKQGFGVPLYEWFYDKYGVWARKELFNFCERTDYFDRKTIFHLFEKGQGEKIWSILNFALWHKEFIS